MPTPDPNNITALDAEDYVYVSKKNWARKQNVEDNNTLGELIGKPAPITGIVLTFFDMIVELFLKLVFYIFDITQYAFDYVNNILLGNFQGLIPKSFTKGKVITTKFFRYTLTALMPPFGIILSKGIYGWFSVLVCTLLTYVNFLAGMIYAFVITSRNRYADQYEEYQTKLFANTYPQDEANEDISAFVSSMSLIVLIGLFIVFCFSYF